MSDDPSVSRVPHYDFRVVCFDAVGTGYLVTRSAPDAGAAVQSAIDAGHAPVLCLPPGLSRHNETLIIHRWRQGSDVCPSCGYSLAGLATTPCMVCPECGLGAMPAGPVPAPRCGACGYSFAGINVGPTPVPCPECGATDPPIRGR